MKTTFKVSYYLRSNYENKEGKSPVMLRIYLGGEKANLGSTKIFVDKSKWSNKTSRMIGRTAEALSINASIDALTTTLMQIYRKYETSEEFAMGFVDGINDSLNNSYDLEALEASDEIVLDINLEKLYFNMLEAKAEYLYTLPQWDGIFSPEKRKEIQKAYRESTIVRNENKVGRNDACPCGSGKKYKKCCGK